MKSQLANDVAALHLVERLRTISNIFSDINRTYIDPRLADMAAVGLRNATEGIDDIAVAFRLPKAHKVGAPKLVAVK